MTTYIDDNSATILRADHAALARIAAPGAERVDTLPSSQPAPADLTQPANSELMGLAVPGTIDLTKTYGNGATTPWTLANPQQTTSPAGVEYTGGLWGSPQVGNAQDAPGTALIVAAQNANVIIRAVKQFVATLTGYSGTPRQYTWTPIAGQGFDGLTGAAASGSGTTATPDTRAVNLNPNDVAIYPGMKVMIWCRHVPTVGDVYEFYATRDPTGDEVQNMITVDAGTNTISHVNPATLGGGGAFIATVMGGGYVNVNYNASGHIISLT